MLACRISEMVCLLAKKESLSALDLGKKKACCEAQASWQASEGAIVALECIGYSAAL
jgi:hypothetical protein